MKWAIFINFIFLVQRKTFSLLFKINKYTNDDLQHNEKHNNNGNHFHLLISSNLPQTLSRHNITVVLYSIFCKYNFRYMATQVRKRLHYHSYKNNGIRRMYTSTQHAINIIHKTVNYYDFF